MESLGLNSEFSADVNVSKDTFQRLLDMLNDDKDIFVVGHEIEMGRTNGEKIAKYVCTEVREGKWISKK